MEIKLFGKSLFSAKKNGHYIELASNQVRESKFLIDFHKDTGGDRIEGIENWVIAQNTLTGSAIVGPGDAKPLTKAEEKKVEKPHLTPKEVHQLEMLHDKSFKLITDAKYVDEQLASFRDKLGLIKTAEYDMRRGVQEIASITQRLENRKKYDLVKATFEEFPYTTTSKINAVLRENDYLRLGQVEQFLADMPKEAVDAMKRYNAGCDKLCKKQAVFYIIADKKDFQKSDRRRDPILLAQSPFGHFWQILGAWDKEMMFLEQL